MKHPLEKSLRLCLPFSAFGICACTPAAATPPIYGIARSIDGDSLHIGNTEIRLFGIDAPEWDQSCRRNGADWACGHDAANQLARLVTGKEVRCDPIDVDKNGRTVARCSVGTTDVNRAMVATGFAVAFRQYSKDYVSAEETAKASKRGIWAGTFQMPRDYRDAGEFTRHDTRGRASINKGPAKVHSALGSGGCVIKGNRGSNGWIYHVPGMPYYEKTRAEEMFCSEADAQRAGYRRAKVK